MSISRLVRTVFLVDLLQGLWVTFRNQHPKNICTEQYPATRPAVGERFRGAPRLNVNPLSAVAPGLLRKLFEFRNAPSDRGFEALR